MKRILVFSDTHRKLNNCITVIDNIINVDLIIHLGDMVSDVLELKKIYKDISFEYVPGNNDFFSGLNQRKIIEFDGIKLLLTHGHLYSKETLYYLAKENSCSFVLTGHTHIASKESFDGITFLNPGSISSPRDGKFSYAVIETENTIAKSAIIRSD